MLAEELQLDDLDTEEEKKTSCQAQTDVGLGMLWWGLEPFPSSPHFQAVKYLAV